MPIRKLNNVTVRLLQTSHSLQQLKNAKNDVIDVAESRRFGLLGMMQTSRPVDCYVCCLLVQLDRTS